MHEKPALAQRQCVGLFYDLAWYVRLDVLDAVDPREVCRLKLPVVIKIRDDDAQ